MTPSYAIILTSARPLMPPVKTAASDGTAVRAASAWT